VKTAKTTKQQLSLKTITFAPPLSRISSIIVHHHIRRIHFLFVPQHLQSIFFAILRRTRAAQKKATTTNRRGGEKKKHTKYTATSGCVRCYLQFFFYSCRCRCCSLQKYVSVILLILLC